MSRTNQDDVIQASTPLELEVLFRDGKESKMTGQGTYLRAYRSSNRRGLARSSLSAPKPVRCNPIRKTQLAVSECSDGTDKPEVGYPAFAQLFLYVCIVGCVLDRVKEDKGKPYR